MEYEEFENEAFSTDFDDRIDMEIEVYFPKNDDSERLKEEDGFYRPIDEY
ncbi:hypothetical protein [Ekhidna sp.]